MSKIIKYLLLFFLLNCEIVDEATDETKGACKAFYFNEWITWKACSNEYKEDCENTGSDLNYTFEEDTTCQDEGYTKGCGSYFKSEGDDC